MKGLGQRADLTACLLIGKLSDREVYYNVRRSFVAMAVIPIG